MVTFQEIPDETQKPIAREEIKTEKEAIQKAPEPTKDELYGVEGQLRKAEQIQSNRNSTRAQRKEGSRILTKVIQSEPYEVLADMKVLPQVVKLTCRLFSDDSESIRTDATKNIEVLIDVLNNPNLLAGLIPTLESRLGTERIVEDCEELRLEQLTLLFRVIKSHGEVIPGYMPEISLILSRTLADPFVTARLVANEILRHMIATYPYNFHQYAEFMLPALFTSSNHQQSKVRASTVTSTWQLLKIAAPEHLRKNMSILVQRTFDESAVVRTALMIEVVDYLKTYRDRYSFFNLLIPILFGMFDDEDPVIADKSKREWNEIGAVFEKENETDLKEEMDYPVSPPQAWPDSVPRSRLGCRELCGRNLMGMMNGLANDAKDNLSLENRIMATRIYGLVISHCERNIHQHVPKIIEVVNRACSDTDPQVRKNGDEIANWLTILATPELVLKVVLPGVQGFSAGTLSVLENFAKNVWNEIELQNKLAKALFKAMPHMVRDKRQIETIRRTLEHLSKRQNINVFNVVCSEIYCQALNDKETDYEPASITNFGAPLDDVIGQVGSKFISANQGSLKSWNQHSNEFWTWICFLQFARYQKIDKIFDESRMIFEDLLDTRLENQRIRLKTVEVLFRLFQSDPESLPIQARKTLIGLVSKNLTYRVGRIESAVKLASVSMLCSLLPLESEMDQVMWYNGHEATIHSVVEDDEVCIRKHGLFLVSNLLHEISGQYLETDFLHKVVYKFLERLDDPHNDFRILATRCAQRIYSILDEKFHGNYDKQLYGAHTEHGAKVLVLHFEDENPDVKTAVYDALKCLIKLDQKRVEEIAREKISNSSRLAQLFQ
ncbi:unnamed protein product [Oikopleura dioica]|uniref:TOG domain-containing protein n=1 Tax=Oikopleura dioica TaxID=34765 RepID=E4WV00_OIKDI|nr:unnamed protein product [Oikopleura dioica]